MIQGSNGTHGAMPKSMWKARDIKDPRSECHLRWEFYEVRSSARPRRSASDHVCVAVGGGGTGAARGVAGVGFPAGGVAAGGFAAGGFAAGGFAAGGFAAGGFALRLPTEAATSIAIERNDASSRSDIVHTKMPSYFLAYFSPLPLGLRCRARPICKDQACRKSIHYRSANSANS